jgi:hypothetical protein
MYFPTGRRSSNRDGPSPSRQKAGGKLNKSVRRYIITSETVPGSAFRVQGLNLMDTSHNVSQNLENLSYAIE